MSKRTLKSCISSQTWNCDVLGCKKPCGKSLTSGAWSSRTNVNLKPRTWRQGPAHVTSWRSRFAGYDEKPQCNVSISLPLYSIQFNSFWMQRDKIPQLQCERSRWREGTADASRKYVENAANRIRNESDQERQCIPESLQSKCSLCNDRLQELHCKIHVSGIFPTDWAENSRSAIASWAATGSEWSEMVKFYCNLTIYEQSRTFTL